MLDSESIYRFIVERIANIYWQPLAFGATADGVDLVLHYYHELLANVLGQQRAYEEIRIGQHMAEEANADSFAGNCRRLNEGQPEQRVAECVVGRWMQVDGMCGFDIPLDEIRTKWCK